MPKDEPTTHGMLEWIAETYGLTTTELSRMFQADTSTIRRWRRTGRMSARNRLKLENSYRYLFSSLTIAQNHNGGRTANS